MTVTVAQILRHPIKSLGREDLGAVTLHQGQTMPWDRTWAVAHEHSKADGTSWARCQNFLRVASSPALAAATSTLDEVSQTLTLRHPARPDLTVNPDADPKAIVDWVQPLVASTRSAAAQIMRVPGRGMTDSDYPSITLANLASHRAVEDQIGHHLSLHRWRCNLWLDGLAPWQEFEWVGKTITIGDVTFAVRAAKRNAWG